MPRTAKDEINVPIALSAFRDNISRDEVLIRIQTSVLTRIAGDEVLMRIQTSALIRIARDEVWHDETGKQQILSVLLQE